MAVSNKVLDFLYIKNLVNLQRKTTSKSVAVIAKENIGNLTSKISNKGG